MIRLESITKFYRVGVEEIHALDGVSLALKANDYVAIMGASGSGKSTLINIIGCLDKPSGGQYSLDGHLVSRMGPRALARVRNSKIGFVFQSFELMPRMTALQNVEMPLIYSPTGWFDRRRQARAALERVGLGDRMRHRPNQLSGGQKQRVAIARALIARPAILLADEPTGNLDSTTAKEILGLFDTLYAEGQTIIVVTHDPVVARRARRIVELRDGKVVADQAVTEAVDAEEAGNG